MSKKNILYVFFLFWQLSQVLDIYCDPQSEDFKKYVINSLNHIRVQNGWYSIQQTEIKLENLTINIESITGEIIDDNNFIQKLYFIICLLNCEYTNTMQTFNVMLSFIINKCEINILKNQNSGYIYCTKIIVYIFNFSINMFKKMLKAAKYLDKIDLRIIDSPILNIKTVDNEINYLYTHALELSKFSTFHAPNNFNWVETFESIKDFNKKTELMISNLYKHRKVCGTEHESSILINLLMKYNIDQMEKLVEDSKDYINNIYKDLELYIFRIIDNCYSKLGFEQLKDTNTFKHSYFKSRRYGENEGIALCKHFISHATGWMSWKHIAVKTEFTNEKSLYFKDIEQMVDKKNYYFVRSYLALILRCRYIEIFHNFNIMLGHIVYACKYENKINCAVKLYETLMASDDMFKKMLIALITLRHYTKDKKYQRQELLIERAIEFFMDYLNDVRKKYFSPLLFTNDGFFEALTFLENVAKVQSKDLQTKLNHVIEFNMKYCIINKCESDIDLITTFELLLQTNTLTEYSTIYQSLCDILESFILKVVKNDYEDLGFNNLPCKN
ncbi:uncharacterized protein LOC126893523 [Daktulosphaira vitifoliae]|uniref:uncharacterized protein LOC126893523 n=1 Tax=Daktulosphaira vitifoliae TaxID=58002 RepID=UPI0021A9E8BA|nr:uncharacterized protein LOC126893523 [Daktulosphaira vitifoliae]